MREIESQRDEKQETDTEKEKEKERPEHIFNFYFIPFQFSFLGMPIDSLNNYGDTSLHLAAANGHFPVCTALIKKERR